MAEPRQCVILLLRAMAMEVEREPKHGKYNDERQSVLAHAG